MPGKMASTPAYLLVILPLVLFLCEPAAPIEFPEGYDRKNLPQPPEFTETPDEEIVVYPTDDVTLKCEASGNPSVEFRWTKNGKEFDPLTVPGMRQPNGGGTLVITTNNGNVAARFQGVYRCYASNILGTAMSPESRVIAENSPQWPKESVAPIRVEEGSHTVLPCNPPTSAVPPKIYWLNSKIEHITQDERVTMGQDGNLYFANVQMKDSHPDYICNAHFQGPRVIIQKEPIELQVFTTNTFSHQKPILIVPDKKPNNYVALLGKALVLECIVAGLPTPSVEWRRIGGLKLSPHVVFENYNKTLRIPRVVEDDDGEYQCVAQNDHGSIQHSYHVTVEAAPYWIKEPESQIYVPGENVRVDCKVDGRPKPSVEWSINGIPIAELMPDSRRSIQEGALILSQVQPNDTAVIQCHAQNGHGSLLTNAYILVVRLPAVILTPDGVVYSVVENQSAILHCKTFGAPRPSVKWFTEVMYPILEDDRSFQFPNGTLQLSEVDRSDAGNYTCFAENDQNKVSITAQLVVKGATQFETGPTDREEKKGGSVTFDCKVLFDETIPERGVKWQLNGQVIEESDDNDKYIINTSSLTVTDLDYTDQGTYSCVAWTSLDSIKRSAQLLVYGNPGRVSDLELSEERDGQVKLTWTPGDDHNRPIENYTVYCEERTFGQGKVPLVTVPGNQPWAKLSLSPFRRYFFYVQAINSEGKSELSDPSSRYDTEPAAPRRNPSDVEGKGDEPNNMIISWTPLPKEEWNAPMLKYRVLWRQQNQTEWHEEEVEGPPFVVSDTPIFSPYEIKVQAHNEFGEGPETSTAVGYSGEDVPEAVPEAVGVEVINSTTVILTWMLPNRDKVFGHIEGFKIYYSRLGDAVERNRREAHFHNHYFKERLVEGDVSEAILGGLKPWSQYRVQMTVKNGRGEGPRSEAIEFNTPEGVPSPPESFHVEKLSATDLALEWAPPRFPNGKLLNYWLNYYPANQTGNQSGLMDITIPASQCHFNLTGLIRNISYTFHLQVETRVGKSKPIILEEHAMRDAVVWMFGNISLGDTGENYTIITWNPHPNHRAVEFEVHLMNKTDRDQWHILGKGISSLGSYSIPDLEPGKQYRVRFVKEHRTGDDQIIWETNVETSGIVREDYQKNILSEGWFIGFVSAIVLLILVLVLLCFIKRSKGGKYSGEVPPAPP